jgi:hypothetical protein
VREREELVRSKITTLLAGDARRVDPLHGRGGAPYATVVSAYCADSATADLAEWESYLRNISGLVRPGGLFVTAALRHSTGYVVGGKTFPSAFVDEADVLRVLDDEFDWDDGVVDVVDLSESRSHGYTSVILARVRKRPTDGSRQPGAYRGSSAKIGGVPPRPNSAASSTDSRAPCMAPSGTSERGR